MPMFISVSSISVHIGLLEFPLFPDSSTELLRPGRWHALRSSYSPRFALVSQLFTRFLSNKGLNITEVAHGYQATIKQYVQQLGMVNSYDTWHGKVSIGFQLN